jgi:hypothetical protein
MAYFIGSVSIRGNLWPLRMQRVRVRGIKLSCFSREEILPNDLAFLFLETKVSVVYRERCDRLEFMAIVAAVWWPFQWQTVPNPLTVVPSPDALNYDRGRDEDDAIVIATIPLKVVQVFMIAAQTVTLDDSEWRGDIDDRISHKRIPKFLSSIGINELQNCRRYVLSDGRYDRIVDTRGIPAWRKG